VFVAPETSQRAGSKGLQRLSVPIEVRAMFGIAALAAFAVSQSQDCSRRWRRRFWPMSSASITMRAPG
jgi:hypothetical protein